MPGDRGQETVVRRPWPGRLWARRAWTRRLWVGTLRSKRPWDAQPRVRLWWRNQDLSMGSHTDGQSLPVAGAYLRRKEAPSCPLQGPRSSSARQHGVSWSAAGWLAAGYSGSGPAASEPKTFVSLVALAEAPTLAVHTRGPMLPRPRCGSVGQREQHEARSPMSRPHCSLPSARSNRSGRPGALLVL